MSETLNYKDIQQLLLEYNNDSDVQKLRNYYCNKSIPEIFAVSRRELSHSAFLAWLFDSNCNRDLGLFPLKKLFEIIIRRKIHQENSKSEIEQDLVNAILSDNLSLNNIVVKTEDAVKKGRIDILIESDIRIKEKDKKIRIIIENKVSTTEHDDQTTKYSNHYKNNENESNIFVFLTPKPSIELDEQKQAGCSCEKFIEINYQDILNYILQPILKENNISDKTKFVISEYIQSLSAPALEENNDNNNNSKKSIIMAIGQEETDLLTAFWEKNEKLIMAAVEAISIDVNQNEDIREKAKTFKEAMQTSNKDYSKYIFNGKEYNKANLPHAIVKNYVEQNPNITFNELKKVFPDSAGGNPKWGIFQTKEKASEIEANESRRRHRLKPEEIIKLADAEIAVCSAWFPATFNNFLDKIQENGIKVQKA